jgi:hypothetical protein
MQGENDVHTLVIGRDAMACRFEVMFNAGEVPDATAIAVDCLDLVDEIESQITVYRDSSDLARLNATAAAGWQRRQRRWLLPARSGGARRTLPLAYLESLSEFIP